MFLLWDSLVAIGGCHHLDGLVQQWRISTSWWLFMAVSSDCEGSCTFPGGVPKGNSSKLLMSLSYLTCGSVLTVSYRVDEVCETPLSRRTTKCWSTQRGLACWQAHEPREKIGCLLTFGILSAIDFIFILWLVHPSTRRYNHPTHSFIFLQTSGDKLFSVIRIESLFFI